MSHARYTYQYIVIYPDKKLPANKRGKGAKKNLTYTNHYYINYGIAAMGVLLAGVSLLRMSMQDSLRMRMLSTKFISSANDLLF